MPQQPAFGTAAASRRSMDQGQPSAYDRGLHGSQPPIGAHGSQRQAPPESGYRRASAPIGHKGLGSRFPGQQAPMPQGKYGDEDSLTPEDEYFDPGEEMPPRRASKAERFFGIGEAGGDGHGRRASFEEGDDGFDGGKSKQKWKIWK